MSHSPRQMIDLLRQHPARESLCARVAQVVLAAAEHQRVQWLATDEVAEFDSVALVQLDRDAADTPLGNALEILDRGAQSLDEWSLLSACLAEHVATDWGTLDGGRTVDQLLWLAGATPCNPWLFLDAATDSQPHPIWEVTRDRLAEASAAAQLAVFVGLAEATGAGALELKRRFMDHCSAPTLAAVLRRSAPVEALCGELTSAPMSRWVLVLKALSGWLAVSAVCRLVARYALGSRCTVELRVAGDAVEVFRRRHLLGREISERRTFLNFGDIRLLTRETRYAGLALYMGLLALVLGTLVGVTMLSDAVRVSGGSPTLVAYGLGFIAAGIVVDLLLSSLARFKEGKTRVILQPRRGRRVAVGHLRPAVTDPWLARLAALQDR